MTHTASELYAHTVTLTPAATAGRVAVLVDGVELGTVKDGNYIVRNAERLLRADDVYRTSGYSLDADGNLTATATRLA